MRRLKHMVSMNDIDLIDLVFAVILLYLGYTFVCKKSEFLNDIFYSMKESWTKDPRNPTIERLKEKVRKVVPQIDQVQLREGEKSYTLDKQKIYLCLADKQTGKTYNDNMLVYVLLHELAHVLNKEDIGHTPAFNRKFDEILKVAEAKGIYDPNLPLVPGYCE